MIESDPPDGRREPDIHYLFGKLVLRDSIKPLHTSFRSCK